MTTPSGPMVACDARTATDRALATAPIGSGNRLPGVDGLRALAAMWVVLFHVRAFSHAHLWPGLDLVARSGSTGVSLFLILSGFCLYLPVAGGRTDRFRTTTFLRRRCSRLLPAYLTTLLLLLVAHVALGGHAGLPKLSGGALATQAATHLTLTHQLFPSTFYGLNGAYWSLGLEWELYLTLPLLVLAVRRWSVLRVVGAIVVATVLYRLGLYAAVRGGLLAPNSVTSKVVLPNLFLGRWSEFGLGMLAAELYRTGRAGAWGRRWTLPSCAAAVLGLLATDNPLSHVLFGVVFFTLLLRVLAGANPVARMLSWRPLVAVGVISYSLYLVHQPLIQIFAAILGVDSGTAPRTVFLELLLFLPVIFGAAWLLFLTVERYSIGSARGRAWWTRPFVRGAAAPAAAVMSAARVAPQPDQRPAGPAAAGSTAGAVER